jgi:adenylate kinase
MYDNLAALLLLGLTGSGKTPLGQTLHLRGVHGLRCAHFDFGEHLRRIVAGGQSDQVISIADIEFLRGILHTGALLEDKDFPIAKRILRRFLSQQGADAETLVVLNGLPRHVGQARAMASLLQVHTVVNLRCSAETVLARIAGNAGGDRSQRKDDRLADVRLKLEIFDQRTALLVDFYDSIGARIIQLSVSADTAPEQMWLELARKL